jgi:hypothetical protein
MPDETPADDRFKGLDTGSEKEPLRQLTLEQSRSSSSPQSSWLIVPASPQDDLDGLAARCRAKGAAARSIAERQRCLPKRDEPSDDDTANNSEIRLWADEVMDAFYWVSAGEKSGLPHISDLDIVGGYFETLTEGLRVVRDTEHLRSGFEKALPLLVEAQSAVRRSLQRLKVPADLDELVAYDTVREATARHRVFLKRFLRADELATLETWPGLLDRIATRREAEPKAQRQ